MITELLILFGINIVAKDLKNCCDALIEEIEEEFEDEDFDAD